MNRLMNIYKHMSEYYKHIHIIHTHTHTSHTNTHIYTILGEVQTEECGIIVHNPFLNYP